MRSLEVSSSADATDFHDLKGRLAAASRGHCWFWGDATYRIGVFPFRHSSSGGKYVLSVGAAMSGGLHEPAIGFVGCGVVYAENAPPGPKLGKLEVLDALRRGWQALSQAVRVVAKTVGGRYSTEPIRYPASRSVSLSLSHTQKKKRRGRTKSCVRQAVRHKSHVLVSCSKKCVLFSIPNKLYHTVLKIHILSAETVKCVASSVAYR